jgi:hypothetical protein
MCRLKNNLINAVVSAPVVVNDLQQLLVVVIIRVKVVAVVANSV